jgi:hypothetical protein
MTARDIVESNDLGRSGDASSRATTTTPTARHAGIVYPRRMSSPNGGRADRPTTRELRGSAARCVALLVPLMSACRIEHDTTPSGPAWTTGPARACPRVEPLPGARPRAPESSQLVALGCSPARPCALIRDSAETLRYLELDAEDGLRAALEQPISLPRSIAYRSLGAALTERDVAVVSVSPTQGADAARWTADGAPQWITQLGRGENFWRHIEVLGDDVAVLSDDPDMPLRLLNRGDGAIRRRISLSPQHAAFDSACLERVGERLFAAWTRTAWSGHERRHLLETAWVDPARDDVLIGASQVLSGPPGPITCEPQGGEVGVLSLHEWGRVHFTRIDSTGAIALPYRLLFRLTNRRGSVAYDRPSLVAHGGLFAFAFRSEPYGHGKAGPDEAVVTFLTPEGARTRLIDLGPGAAALGLVRDSHGVAALYPANGALAAARVHCTDHGRPSP